MSINIRRNEGKPEELILRAARRILGLKGARHASGNVGEPWHSMTTRNAREVGRLQGKHDMVIYEVGGYTNLIYPIPLRESTCRSRPLHRRVAESVEAAWWAQSRNRAQKT
jgi:hypothetical protein